MATYQLSKTAGTLHITMTQPIDITFANMTIGGGETTPVTFLAARLSEGSFTKSDESNEANGSGQQISFNYLDIKNSFKISSSINYVNKITFQGVVYNDITESFLIDLGSSASEIAFNGCQLSSTFFTVKTARNILLTNETSISGIELELIANANDVKTNGSFIGIEITNGSQVTLSMSATIHGTGGNIGTNNHGVSVTGRSKITGNRSFTINGVGGGSNGDRNIGVNLIDSDISVSSVGAFGVTVTGVGGGLGTSAGNRGIYIDKGEIYADGDESVSVNGTGGNSSGSLNIGVQVVDVESSIRSKNGQLNVNGTGGGTGSANNGVYVVNEGKIVASGTGTVMVIGRGDIGVHVTNSSKISSENGNITVNGTGGVIVSIGGEIVANSFGTVNVKGEGTESNHGVLIDGANSKIASLGGNVIVDGTTTGDNNGVTVSGGGQIYGGFDIDMVKITGKGGGTGVEVKDAGSMILGTEVDGESGMIGVYLTGVSVLNGGLITSNLNHNITVTGRAVSLLGILSAGVYVSGIGSKITSNRTNTNIGSVTVNGYCDGYAIIFVCVLVDEGGEITSGVKDNVMVNATLNSSSTSYTISNVNVVDGGEISATGNGEVKVDAKTVMLPNK